MARMPKLTRANHFINYLREFPFLRSIVMNGIFRVYLHLQVDVVNRHRSGNT
jgi:hypothetical protein